MGRVNNITSQKSIPTGKCEDFCWKSPQISRTASSVKLSLQRSAMIYQLNIMRQKKFYEDGDFLYEFCTFSHVNLFVSCILALSPSLQDLRETNCP